MKMAKSPVCSSFFKGIFPSPNHFSKSVLAIIFKNKVNFFGSLGLPSSIFLSTNGIGVLVKLASINFQLTIDYFQVNWLQHQKHLTC
jgi:hypothetical protein